MAGKRAGLAHMPAGVWALGMVSLLMDVSSEMIHSLLPVFMTTVLGASVALVGLVEGIGEAAAAIVKVFSGAISDRLQKRKALAVLGYGMAVVTKPLFPLAGSIGTVMAARLIDRVGKGIRGAPRDALLADITPPDIRGAAFGLRQTMDTIGAVIGPLLAIVLMTWFAGDMRAVFWVSVIPATLSIAVLVLFVHEPKQRIGETAGGKPKLDWSSLTDFPRRYWWLVAVGAFLALARMGEAFLILRAETVGMGIAYVPIVLVVMSAAYSLSAFPAGVLSDRLSRPAVFLAGNALMLAADLILAFCSGVDSFLPGVVAWGLHMGMTQGLIVTMIADTVAPHQRGTAFGLSSLVSGGAILVSGIGTGLLWDAFGPAAAFLASAVAILVSSCLLVFAARYPIRH